MGKQNMKRPAVVPTRMTAAALLSLHFGLLGGTIFAATALPSDTAAASSLQERDSAFHEFADSQTGFRIDQPGTITFTVGIKIVGKVEKPEVVIFLPKEKPYFRPILFSHSFTDDILEPLAVEATAALQPKAPVGASSPSER